MICPPCRQGGRILTYSKKGFSADVTLQLKREAAADHGQCQAPTTCTCQHEVTLDALNEKGFK